MIHRPEIDGLRAVAVLPVILFHAGLTVLPGGYLGVDVFFVLSGYLITGLLLEDLEAGRFSLIHFYERRVRRILPALFLVIAATLPFAWAWMLPDQALEYGQSLIAVVLFVSNILFWRQDGYFAAPAELKPMLHTWSLAVEEQFYVLFPLLLLVLWRLGRRRAYWAIVALAVASLALSEIGWRLRPEANFYLAPTRAWELLAGSMCAFRCLARAPKSSGTLAALGLGLILGSMALYGPQTPIPSLWALAPVGGTMLILRFGQADTWVGRILTLPPMVGVGLISYSAYLWHQPLFAFARVRLDGSPPPVVMATLAVAALLLAWATWAFVEQPFRRRPKPRLPGATRIFLASAFGMALFSALGLWALGTGGWPGRLDPALRQAMATAAPVFVDCGQGAMCAIGDPGGRATGLAFVGDSHMGRYAWELDRILTGHGLNALLVTQGYCAPALDLLTRDPAKNADMCRDAFQPAFRAVLKDPQVDTVILGAEWALYTTGWRHMDSTSAFDFAQDGHSNSDPMRNEAEFTRAWAATLAAVRASGKRLVVIGPVPEYGVLVGSAVIHARMMGESLDDLRLPRDEHGARNHAVERTFAADPEGITFIDPADVLCRPDYCLPHDLSGNPLYNDGSHLGEIGLALVVPLILDQLGLLPG